MLRHRGFSLYGLEKTGWTKTGKYTGTTDLELTAEGIKQVTSTTFSARWRWKAAESSAGCTDLG
ncbi:hypothetical protein HD806DRAFT_474996 [Xylariaceae sp. AK1471]|nr:hypothetical protein HD806DRAFT_474996 [Xylariaceae sp. AK1471]